MIRERHEINIGGKYWVFVDGEWHRVWVYAGEVFNKSATFDYDGDTHTMSWDAFYDKKPQEAQQ